MAQQTKACPVCFSTAVITPDSNRDSISIECPRCGRFSVTRTAEKVLSAEVEVSEAGKPRLGGKNSRRRANASAWIRENAPVVLDYRHCARLVSLRTPTVSERLEKLLLSVADAQETVNSVVSWDSPELQAMTWSLNRDDLVGLVKLAVESKYLRDQNGNSDPESIIFAGSLTARGWERVEQLRGPNPQSAQGFVAMWFDDTMTQVYDEALAPAIEAAGYRPHRVDRREYIGRIDDEIVAQIRRSRFVVADFTGHRGGVYWEAGLAEGFGLPVIFTCQREELDEIHFDVRQNNTIGWSWDDLDELRERLRSRIEAVLGRGPRATPEGS